MSAPLNKRLVSLVVLGTGHGSTAVYEGHASAAYVVCMDGQPVLLVGAGVGVTERCMWYFGKIPRDVFVWSNRTHVAGELPILLAVEANRHGDPNRLLGSASVLARIRDKRMAELHDIIASEGRSLDDVVRCCPLLPLSVSMHGILEGRPHIDGLGLQDAPALVVRSIPTKTSEVSAGVAVFVAHSGGQPLFAIPGDCQHAPELLGALFDSFPVVVVDARPVSSCDHASIDEVAQVWKGRRAQGANMESERTASGASWPCCLLGHYGGPQDAPSKLKVGSTGAAALPGGMYSVLPGMTVHVEYSLHLNREGHASTLELTGVRLGLIAERERVVAVTADVLPLGGAARALSPAAKPLRQSRPSPLRRRRDAPPIVQQQSKPPNSSTAEERSTTMHSSRDTRGTGNKSMGASRGISSPERKASTTRLATKGAGDSVADGVASALRIYAFSNEDKSAPGTMIVVQAFRNVQQLRLRVSEKLSLKPLHELHLVPSGAVVSRLEQLYQGAYVVATQLGGESFSLASLPHALRPKLAGPSSASAASRAAGESLAKQDLPVVYSPTAAARSGRDNIVVAGPLVTSTTFLPPGSSSSDDDIFGNNPDRHNVTSKHTDPLHYAASADGQPSRSRRIFSMVEV